MIELLETATPDAVIKVVGVGGCGGNAVDHAVLGRFALASLRLSRSRTMSPRSTG